MIKNPNHNQDNPNRPVTMQDMKRMMRSSNRQQERRAWKGLRTWGPIAVAIVGFFFSIGVFYFSTQDGISTNSEKIQEVQRAKDEQISELQGLISDNAEAISGIQTNQQEQQFNIEQIQTDINDIANILKNNFPNSRI